MRPRRTRHHHRRFPYAILFGLLTSVVVAVRTAAACPVCFGEADTGAAHGLQAAIAVLGGTTLFAIGAIAVVVLRIRSRAAANASQPMDESLQ